MNFLTTQRLTLIHRLVIITMGVLCCDHRDNTLTNLETNGTWMEFKSEVCSVNVRNQNTQIGPLVTEFYYTNSFNMISYISKSLDNKLLI